VTELCGACSKDDTLPASFHHCNSMGASCLGSSDCDGLPDHRDPFAGACNDLVFDEPFTFNPWCTWTIHSATADKGAWAWGCGWQTQTKSTVGVTWDLADGFSAASTDYLVEARVRLGPIGNDVWGVGIASRVVWNSASQTATDYLVCEVTHDPGAGAGNPITIPDVRILLSSAAAGSNSGWPYPNSTSQVDGSDGKEYTLQLWYAANATKVPGLPLSQPCSTAPDCPAVVCRLCDEPTKTCRVGIFAIYSDLTTQKHVPTTAGTVGLRVYGRQASFDTVRAYSFTQP